MRFLEVPDSRGSQNYSHNYLSNRGEKPAEYIKQQLEMGHILITAATLEFPFVTVQVYPSYFVNHLTIVNPSLYLNETSGAKSIR